MRRLLPAHADEVDLLDAYAYPADRPWVRANMVCSVDGSAVVEGRSRGLSTPGDKQVFATLRGLCDVVLVGAGTARAEGYRAMRPKEAYGEWRAAQGQQPAPVLALVSRRLDLDPASQLFQGGQQRTIVLTPASSDPGARARLAGVADVVVAGDEQVDIGAALDAVVTRGGPRVLCEGGPHLLADVTAAGRLDELCVTLSPFLVGGTGTRILAGSPPPRSALPIRPTQLLEDDGALFARYIRR